MDTGTRDLLLSTGDFVEDFNYDKWQRMVNAGRLDAANVVAIEDGDKEKENSED